MKNGVRAEKARQFSIVYIIVAAALWGTIGLFVHYLSGLGFSSYHLIVFRSFVASVALFGYLAVFDRQKLKVRLRDVWFFLLSSGVTVTLFNLCYFNAIKFSGMSIASVLLYTAPIFVSLFSFLIFGEKFTVKKAVALVFALLGCVLVSGVFDATDVNAPGILFGLGAGITYASYSIFSKIALGVGEIRTKKKKRNVSGGLGDENCEIKEPKRSIIATYSPLTYTAYNALFGGIFMLPFCDYTGLGGMLTAEWYVIPFIIVFAFVTNLIPYVLYTKGLMTVDAGRASITATVEPIVATLLGTLLFRERLSVIGGIGVGLVLFAAVILNVNLQKVAYFKKNSK